MTDLRALITQLCDELDHNRQCLLDDRRLTHPLSDKARAALFERETDVDSFLRLAAIIREVDGSNSLGAAALAEAILSHPDNRWGK